MMNAPPTPAEFAASIEAFCRENGIAETIFCKRAVNDGSYLSNLRCGREPTTRTMRRVSDTMAKIKAERLCKTD